MKCYIMFYSTSEYYDRYFIVAESLAEAYDIAERYARSQALTLLGVVLDDSYLKSFCKEY